MTKGNVAEAGKIWWEIPITISGFGGCRKVWLGGQAWEEAVEAEILEQYWNKNLGKEEKAEEFFFFKLILFYHIYLAALKFESVSHSVSPAVCNPMGYNPARLLCSWNSPDENTGVGYHSLLQGIFPTQGLNPSIYIPGRFFTIWATREAQLAGLSLVNLSCGTWDLISWPGIEPSPPAMGSWSLSH